LQAGGHRFDSGPVHHVQDARRARGVGATCWVDSESEGLTEGGGVMPKHPLEGRARYFPAGGWVLDGRDHHWPPAEPAGYAKTRKAARAKLAELGRASPLARSGTRSKPILAEVHDILCSVVAVETCRQSGSQ